jgi:hypothetical protein
MARLLLLSTMVLPMGAANNFVDLTPENLFFCTWTRIEEDE